MELANAIESPCIRVCVVEGRSGFCQGCRRSLKEIAQWSRYSAEERAAIMATLPQRHLATDVQN